MYFYVNLLHSKLILSPGPKLNVPYKAVMIQNVNVGALALTYYVYYLMCSFFGYLNFKRKSNFHRPHSEELSISDL